VANVISPTCEKMFFFCLPVLKTVVGVGFCGCETAKVKIYLLRRRSGGVAAKIREFSTQK
jgi:hypothetical protein